MRKSNGFTITELLVAISIIAVLLGIGATAGVKMYGSYHSEQVKAMMNGLLGANEEYKAVRGQGPAPDNDSGSSSQSFVTAMNQVGTAEKMMVAAMNSSTGDAFEKTFRNNKIYDRWDTEIQYRTDNDGTGTQSGVDNDKLPKSPFPFFVSAGPDGEFGTDDDISTTEN